MQNPKSHSLHEDLVKLVSYNMVHTVVLKAWSQVRQRQHHPETCGKCRFSGFPPDPLSQKLLG